MIAHPPAIVKRNGKNYKETNGNGGILTIFENYRIMK